MTTPQIERGGGPRTRRHTPMPWLLAVLAGLSTGCGGSTIEPDPAVQAFVGTWDATVFTVTADADPSIVADVLSFATFYISIEPSGQYTATLVHSAVGAVVEIGQLTVIGSTVRLDPSIPADGVTATSNFVFTAPDYLVLDGPTEFDFNGDFVADEAGQAHIELQRR